MNIYVYTYSYIYKHKYVYLHFVCTQINAYVCKYINASSVKVCVTDSTENVTPPKPTKSRNSNSSVQTQIKPKFQYEFVPRDTEGSEFFDMVDFGDVAF